MWLNGKEIKDKSIKTLKDLIEKHNFDIKNIAIVINGEIIKKEKLEEHLLSDKDEIEIIGFVGGG